MAEQIAGTLGPASQRRIVAVAGAPGSGKSTLAAALVERLGDSASLVPMDGFHLDNAILTRHGMLSRKGAPETFDLGGFSSMVARLSAGEYVVAPAFDRTRDISINCVREVPEDLSTVVVEGNYLLLDEPGWRDLSKYWDISIFIDVAEAVLEDRLIQRWRDHGLDEDAAKRRALENDIPNAKRILNARLPADHVV